MLHAYGAYFKEHAYEVHDKAHRDCRAKIASMAHEKFALVFDGWSHDRTHYVAIFPTFLSDSCRVFSHVLLSFSLMCEEDALDAVSYVQYTSFVLNLFWKSWGNVCELIGDNCSTNKAFVKKGNCVFIGCTNH